MDAPYHYPPELLELLVDTIPRLHRGKKALLLFFRGVGVPQSLLADLQGQVERDRRSIDMFAMVRTILTRLNDGGDSRLRERREVIRRVTEWDDFSTCYENWRLEAQGLVSRVRVVVDQKDAFTRMRQAHDKERQARMEAKEAEAVKRRRRAEELESLKKELYSLFGCEDARERGTRFETVLNRLFEHFEILVRESFRRTGDDGEGVVEQIDGIVKLDGRLTLVEAKWKSNPVDRNDISSHLSRVFLREASQGIVLSASEFTSGARKLLRDALPRATVAACTLFEVVRVLDEGGDLGTFLIGRLDETVANH